MSEKIMKTYLVLFIYVTGIAIAVAAMPITIGLFHGALLFVLFCMAITFVMTYQLRDRISKVPWKWLLPFVLFFIAIIWLLMLFTDTISLCGQRHSETGYRCRMYKLGNWMLGHKLFSSEKLMNLSHCAMQSEESALFFVCNVRECVNELASKGLYNPESQEAEQLRETLLFAVTMTNKEVSAESILALADMAMVDSHLDPQRIDSILGDLVSDASLPVDLRHSMVILCGQRYVVEARLALEKICSDYAMPEYLRKASHFAVKCLSDSNRWNAKIFVDGVIEYWHRHGELPPDIRTFCEEFFRKADNESYGYRYFIESMFVVQKVSWKEVVGGAAYLKPKQGYYWNVDEVNSLLRKGLEESKATASGTEISPP